ncbi:autotransporter domain-containing protein [Rhizobium sp. EC-SD404]|uniref:autotransporter outer membrane beta-barrel domain-containing protein n=1 Tax=Rhizobium sp. EC-SD404 TaxID=2038389 RepID=UPI0012557483|nr:autotransporter domain-containing protein [Rhizobium sp. EC-SD404]VVT34250.1 putative Outer membrane autotransporter barrel domain-containing protein [Rhizobium sp. EC-SD404]
MLNGTVFNYGTILGENDGTGLGDGDGVDIDGVGYVENWGRIAGTGAEGTRSDRPTPNQSEGIAISSHATIINHEGAIIEAPAAAISSIGFASITNHGIIRSPNHAYGTYGRSMILNTGTMEGGANEAIISYFDADDVVTNSGTLIGGNGVAVRFGGGDDVFNLQNGSRLVGVADGGTGTDTLNLENGIAFDIAGVVNFERLGATSGSATAFGEGEFESTSVSSGATLLWGNGDAPAPGTGSVSNSGTFVFNQNRDIIFDEVVEGAGTFVKPRSNALTLNADSSGFNGVTRIEAGRINVNGSLGGRVDVLSGATLAGGGQIGSLVSGTGGTVVANDPNTNLRVTGDAAFNDGSIYRATPGSVGRTIAVGGSASITDGAILQLASFVPGSAQSVFTAAGGISGRFTFDNNSPFFDTQLTYTGNAVLADIAKTQAFSSAATNASQLAVADAIDEMPSSALSGAFSNVTDLAQAAAVLDQLSGNLHPSTQGVGIEGATRLRATLSQRMAGALAPPQASVPVLAYGPGALDIGGDAKGPSLWAQATGSWSEREGNGAELSTTAAGILFGADTVLNDRFHVGAAAGYEFADLESAVPGATGEIDTLQLAIYGGTRFGQFQISGGASYAFHGIETERMLAAGGLSERLVADYDGQTGQVFLEGAYDVALGASTLQPFLNLAYVGSATDGFTETGGASALSANGASSDTFVTTVGSRFAHDVAIGGTGGQVFGMLGWQHAFSDEFTETTMNFAGSSNFVVQGAPIARDSAVVEAGLELGFNQLGSVALSYSGAVSSNADRHAVELEWSKSF